MKGYLLSSLVCLELESRDVWYACDFRVFIGVRDCSANSSTATETYILTSLSISVTFVTSLC